jgi:hypothetical protein
MRRGDVRLIRNMMLPDPVDRARLQPRDKLAVVLRDEDDNDNNLDAYLPCLLASSWHGAEIAAYEVFVEASVGSFEKDTVIDARWPFTMQVRDYVSPPAFMLPARVMREVDDALFVGLQMR